MSAGDLVNNLGKLELKLKQVNFRNFRRSELLSGTLDIYVSIYGYVFSDFNRELSKLIASRELELYGKTSKRFVDNLYLIVRDVLHYKPPINKDMFLTNCGFVEMKMIMCTQILELVLLKCKELPSSEKNKKTYRKLPPFPSSTSSNPPASINGSKDGAIKDVRVHSPQNCVDSENTIDYITSTTLPKSENPDHHRVILKSSPFSIKRKISTTEGTKATDHFLYPSSCYQHQPSNYSGLPEERSSARITRHSTSCAISKNPVSKCNIARSLSSKGKPVILEKQEHSPQKVDVKVLKGPLQANDGFSVIQRLIPPEELIRCRDISFCQNSFIQNPKSLVTSHIRSKNPTEQDSCGNKHFAMSELDCSSNTTTTTIIPTTTTPIYIESILSLLPSHTSRINKSQNASPLTSTIRPMSTNSSKQKSPSKETIPPNSKFENITTQKVSAENSQPEEISSTSGSLQVLEATKLDGPQSLSDLHDERSKALQALTQIKNLSKNLMGCTETLRKMQARSQQWEVHGGLLDSLGQNKENTPIINSNLIDVELKENQDGIELLDKTKQNEDQSNQLDYWIAKMNLMECTVKSLESKFKSL